LRRLGVNLPELALAVARDGHEALALLDGVLLRVRLEQRETGDQLLGLGEGAVSDADLLSCLSHPCAERARQTSFRGNELPGPGHLLDELTHPFDHFGAGWNVRLDSLPDRQEP